MPSPLTWRAERIPGYLGQLALCRSVV